MPQKQVLITGAYGLIGNIVYSHLCSDRDRYEVYGLARRQQPSDRIPRARLQMIPGDRFALVDLTDWAGIQRAVQGMDTVVHMAANPSQYASWESVLQSNITGTYHVLEASRLAGVQRVIIASSVQVNFGYAEAEPYAAILEGRCQDIPATVPVLTHEQPARPMNLYASSKVWGEALAHVYAHRHGMSCICLRIGWVVAEDRPPGEHCGADWCSQRDIAQMVQRCIDAPESLRFDTFYAVSDNPHRFVDIEHARKVLGYAPQDGAQGSRSE